MKQRVFMRRIVAILLILSMMISPFYKNKAYAAARTETFKGEGFEVEFKVESQWTGGYNGGITITNTGKQIIKDWSLQFSSKDKITSIWSASIDKNNANTYIINGLEWNKDIQTGSSVTFGFNATFEGSIDIPKSYSIPNISADVDTEVPTAPKNIKATAGTASIDLSWDASSDNVGVVGYRIYRDGVEIGTSKETKYKDDSVKKDNTYIYSVKAYDAAGNLSDASKEVSAKIEEVALTGTPKDTEAPTTPANVKAKMGSDTSVFLTWDASSDNVGVTGYNIFRDNVEIGTSVKLNYTDASVTKGNTYIYKVKAYDASGNFSDASDTASIKIDEVTPTGTPKDTEAPTAPTNLIAEKLPFSEDILFFWDASRDNIGVVGYKIYRDGIEIGKATSTTSFLDNSVTLGSTYVYTVKAYDAAGNLSAPSNKVKHTVSKANDNTSGGTITQDTVWNAGTYIIKDDLIVAKGVTLQVMPGAIIKFDAGIKMTVVGTLVAEGTEQKPIVFTSILDDQYGGSGIQGEDSGWQGIVVESNGKFTGDYIKLRKGGYSEYSYALYIGGKLNLDHSEVSDSDGIGVMLANGCDAIIQNSTIENSARDNIRLDNFDHNECDATVTIKNNIIRNATYYGIEISHPGINELIIKDNLIDSNEMHGIDVYNFGTGALNISGNKITNNGDCPIELWIGGRFRDPQKILDKFENYSQNNIFLGNKRFDYIELTGFVEENLTLHKSTYVLTDLHVESGKTLTIEPGATLLGQDIHVKGKVIAEGTSENPIIFKLSYDIDIEENGEFIGNQIKLTSVHQRDIIGVCESPLLVNGKLYLSNSEISSSGWSNGILIKSDKDVTIINSIINSSIKIDIVESDNAGTISIINNTFQDTISIKNIANSKLTILFNSFKTEWGIINWGGRVIDAPYNYWNSVYGPRVAIEIYIPDGKGWDIVTNGNGAGVTDNVNYLPYLNSEMSMAFEGTYIDDDDEKEVEQVAIRTFCHYSGQNDASIMPANTSVTPEVAIEILKNLSKCENAFKPELGKGGCSWFVTEGNPYVGIDLDKNIDIPVEVTKSSDSLVFDETRLNQMLADAKITTEAEAMIKFRNYNGLSDDIALNSKMRKAFTKYHNKFAEARMWDKVGELVRTSSSKVGEVILQEGSAFSKQGSGKFAVVADASKVQVKGGITALTEIVKGKGVAAEPALVESAEAMASKLKWAGTVRDVFRYGGKVLMVVGIASDVYKVYVAEDKVKAVVESSGGWAGATAGATAFASWWTPADVAGPWAWAAHGVGTLVAGGVGYWVGSGITRTIYELVIEE